jgi:hypothetical protein
LPTVWRALSSGTEATFDSTDELTVAVQANYNTSGQQFTQSRWPRLLFQVVLPITGLAAAYWLVASPILTSPYWGDDHGNSQLPMQLAASGETFLHWWIRLTQEWSATTGRFFPLDVLRAGAMFVLFEERSTYKAAQFLILALSVASFGFLIGVILRSRWAAYSAVGIALMTIQMKSWYDPFWQFAGQQESVNLLACCSLALAVLSARARSGWRTYGAAATGIVAFCAAALTYESSIFLVLAVPLLLIREPVTNGRRILITLSYGSASAILLANLYWQRSHAVVTNPGYQTSLDPNLVVSTLKAQMGGAVPFSYRWHTQGSILPEGASWPTSVLLTILICVVLAGVMTISLKHVFTAKRRGLLLVGFAGALYWFVPSFFVAISSRWQMEVRPGVAYIPVMAGGFALAWLLTVFASYAGRLLRSPGCIAAPWIATPRGLMVAALVPAIGVSCVVGATASSNALATRDPAIVIYQVRRDAYTDAVKRGLFRAIPPTAVIKHAAGDWWDWQNASFTAWYGAPANLRFVTPDAMPGIDCRSEDCFNLVEENPRPGVITYRLERISS